MSTNYNIKLGEIGNLDLNKIKPGIKKDKFTTPAMQSIFDKYNADGNDTLDSVEITQLKTDVTAAAGEDSELTKEEAKAMADSKEISDVTGDDVLQFLKAVNDESKVPVTNQAEAIKAKIQDNKITNVLIDATNAKIASKPYTGEIRIPKGLEIEDGKMPQTIYMTLPPSYGQNAVTRLNWNEERQAYMPRHKDLQFELSVDCDGNVTLLTSVYDEELQTKRQANLEKWKNTKCTKATPDKAEESTGAEKSAATTSRSSGSASKASTKTSDIPQKDPNPPQKENNPPSRLAALLLEKDSIPSVNASKIPRGIDWRTRENCDMVRPQYLCQTIDNMDGTQSTYDKSGRLTQITYTGQGTLKGKKKLEIKRDTDGTVSKYIKYEYDARGKCIKKVNYWYDGRIDEYREYDTLGNCIKEITALCRGCYEGKEYDAHGKLIRQVDCDSNGIVTYCIKYEYDARGKCIKKVNYHFDGTVHYYDKYEYDAHGKLIKQVDYEPDGTVIYYVKCEYDSKGNMTRRTVYSEDGTVFASSQYEYDSKGNVVNEIVC